MSERALALNPRARWHVLKIGREKTRVLLVDDVFVDIAAVQSMACELAFDKEASTYYPGVRARCPDALREALTTMSSGIIRQAYGLSGYEGLADQGSWVSIASTPPDELHPLQCVPHFDSQRHTDFAIMLYASAQSFQGTGFYRHNPTGFENITPERWPVFEQSRQEYSSNGNPRAQAYFYGSNEEYTLMGKIDYKPNRLVIYPGTLLHSGLIDSSQTLSDSPVDGRLTVNVFAGVP